MKLVEGKVHKKRRLREENPSAVSTGHSFLPGVSCEGYGYDLNKFSSLGHEDARKLKTITLPQAAMHSPSSVIDQVCSGVCSDTTRLAQGVKTNVWSLG